MSICRRYWFLFLVTWTIAGCAEVDPESDEDLDGDPSDLGQEVLSTHSPLIANTVVVSKRGTGAGEIEVNGILGTRWFLCGTSCTLASFAYQPDPVLGTAYATISARPGAPRPRRAR